MNAGGSSGREMIRTSTPNRLRCAVGTQSTMVPRRGLLLCTQSYNLLEKTWQVIARSRDEVQFSR